MAPKRAVFKELTFKCRAVRIGSHKFVPKEVTFMKTAIRVNVPMVENSTKRKEPKTIMLDIRFQDMTEVLLNFHNHIPALFITTTTDFASKIRNLLGMHDPSGPYYDPESEDPAHERITLLPESLDEGAKHVITKALADTDFKEITFKEANELLMQSVGRNTNDTVKSKAASTSKLSQNKSDCENVPKNKNFKLDYLQSKLEKLKTEMDSVRNEIASAKGTDSQDRNVQQYKLKKIETDETKMQSLNVQPAGNISSCDGFDKIKILTLTDIFYEFSKDVVEKLVFKSYFWMVLCRVPDILSSKTERAVAQGSEAGYDGICPVYLKLARIVRVEKRNIFFIAEDFQTDNVFVQDIVPYQSNPEQKLPHIDIDNILKKMKMHEALDSEAMLTESPQSPDSSSSEYESTVDI